MTARLPDFLVVGGMRCGSTTLYNILAAHPQIYMPKQKELHFFDHYNADLNGDLNQYKQVFSHRGEAQLCGEVTPDYLTTPCAFERIAETFKDLKVIVVLREPVARLCSHYMMSMAAGFEVLPFEQAIASEFERLQRRDKIADIFHSYVERSTYLPPLANYAERFGRQNVHVLFLEELNANPDRVLSNLWQFLSVDHKGVLELGAATKATNQNRAMFQKKQQAKPRKWHFLLNKFGFQSSANPVLPKISSRQKDKLTQSFVNHNQQLSQWLGRSLPW